MSLRTGEVLEKKTANTEPEKTESSHSDDSRSTKSTEDVALSPKRRNQKSTPPTPLASAVAPQKKLTRNCQSAPTKASENAVPINTINEKDNENNEGQKEFRFEIDSPHEKPKPEYPSLKSLIQDVGFTEKIPQYQACVKFVEAISPKHSARQTEVVDLTSPTEDENVDNNNDILFLKDIDTQKTGDTEMQEDEEHNKLEEEITKDGSK